MTFKDLLAMKESLSTGDSWYALVIVRYRISMGTTGVWLRGDIRVGFEHNVYREKGGLAKSNAKLVEKMGRIIWGLGFEVVTAQEGRKIIPLLNRI